MTRPFPFSARRPVLIGMVHLPALPGAPGSLLGMDQILERVRAEASALVDADFDGILVENFGDAPFYPDQVPAETVAGITRAVVAARESANGLPVGVNVLRNDARAALGIAAATGAAFVRINVLAGTMWTDQGPIVGRAHEIARVRRALVPGCALLADVPHTRRTQIISTGTESAKLPSLSNQPMIGSATYIRNIFKGMIATIM